jgi:hypothetical protein
VGVESRKPVEKGAVNFACQAVAQPMGGHRAPPPETIKTINYRTVPSSFDNLREVLELYKTDLGPTSIIQGEFDRWKVKWAAVAMADCTVTAAETLDQCDELLFPQIHVLLCLFMTLPLTSATAERSFSTLRRLKSYLRSTMGESRLNGLAQMSINRDIPIKPEDVIDELAKKKRRLSFIL